MAQVSFQNKGLIEMAAVTTIGVSAKESKSAIGFFGSGLKYAIAIILREGGSITIWRGHERFVFGLKREVIRGEEFDVVTMNDLSLGFTTRMGVNWAMWQAFRELYCNCLDEAGQTVGTGLPPGDELTTIVVEHDEFYEAFEKRGSIVLTRKPMLQLNGVDVHEGQSNHIYYRGIVAMDMGERSRYTYNITAPMVLTEDRTLKNAYDAMTKLRLGLLGAQDPLFIRELLTTEEGFIEHKFDYDYGDVPSEAWLDIASELYADPSIRLNRSVTNVLYKHRRPKEEVVEWELDDEERSMFNKSIALLKACGYAKIDAHPIHFIENLGPGILGRAVTGGGHKSISISKQAFMQGDKRLAGTILEEHLHLEFLFQDQTRDFQNYLIDAFISLAQKHHRLL